MDSNRQSDGEQESGEVECDTRRTELDSNRQSDGEQESSDWQSDEEVEDDDERQDEEDGNRQSTCQVFLAPATVASSVPQKSSVVAIVREIDKTTKFYTGLVSWKLFEYILNFLVKCCPDLVCIHNRTSMLPSECLLLVLMRLRLNLQVEDLSYRFDLGLSTVSEVFDKWINAMDACLKFLIMWPSRVSVHANMPQIFKDQYPHTRCIIDCSEIFIERPFSYQARAKTYSIYKKHNTLKFIIGITPNGAVSFLSKYWGGPQINTSLIIVDSWTK